MSNLKKFIISLLIPTSIAIFILVVSLVLPKFTSLGFGESFAYTTFTLAIITGVGCSIYFIWGDQTE